MANAKLDKLYDEKYDLEAAVRKVNYITKDVKYIDFFSIYNKVTNVAEELGMDVSDSSDLEWKIKEVREKINALESAMYDLVEPFEDAVRDKGIEIDDLEWELEEAVA
tara:strand:+ start:5940 stop:6263 length:324 start_codon:yes stop_codon:yes gene_type:complete